MTQYMGVNEAAQAIRGTFSVDRSFRGHPEEAHQIKFAKEVAMQLAGTDDAATVIHVMALLREAGIELPPGQEYPKYATRKYDRTSAIVQNEQEEDAWINMEPPAEPDPEAPLRVMDAPVQDLSLDLSKQVPQHVEHDKDGPGRVPSAVTNREAAQDAYARQPVSDRDAAAAAYDEANPGLDHTHVNEEDEVHVEHVDLDAKAPNADKSKGGATYAKPADVGVMAHDDPDRDGVAGQDKDPTHDSVLGTEQPKDRSGDSSAGKTDKNPRPVGVGKNPKRPE